MRLPKHRAYPADIILDQPFLLQRILDPFFNRNALTFSPMDSEADAAGSSPVISTRLFIGLIFKQGCCLRKVSKVEGQILLLIFSPCLNVFSLGVQKPCITRKRPEKRLTRKR